MTLETQKLKFKFDIFCHLKEKYLEYSSFSVLTSKINFNS